VSDNFFHFTLGPVQGFVAQARRTRDLWSGSYLLSYLAGKAIESVRGNGGRIVFPNVGDDPLIEAIESNGKGIDKNSNAARIGSLPNRFKAEAENPIKIAEKAEDVVKTEWENISNKVMDRLRERLRERAGALFTSDTEEIWEGQVKNQWEITWVIKDDGKYLDQRKNMRTHYTEEEPGEKCTICGERQALSGNKFDKRQSVKDWWKEFAKLINGKTGYHFWKDGKERLCAVCTIKRVFPLVSKEAIGWDVYYNYPSTAYMSAVSWFKEVLETLEKEKGDKLTSALEDFVSIAENAGVAFDETWTKIPKLEALVTKGDNRSKLLNFRGDVFFPDAIKNKENFPIKNDDKDGTKRRKLINALSKLTKAAEVKPTPFYALLMMDGDRMGELLSKYSKQQTEISNALKKFTSEVNEIVEEHYGKLLYAGGDDVFAILPVDTALSCAKELREVYVQAFKEKAKNVRGGTISAGIVYAHMNTTLRAVVKDAHLLLDKVAKDKLGRDAFAVRVWKRGGPIITFGKRWEKDFEGKKVGCWVDKIKKLVDAFGPGKEGKQQFASGFFYRFGELIPMIEPLDSRDEKIQLLVAEYLKSREKLGLPEKKEEKREEAKERVTKLLDFSLYLDENDKSKPSADGPLFIRFLVQKEI